MRRACVVGLSALVIAAVSFVSAASGASSPIIAAWTQMGQAGPSNVQQARVVVTGDSRCPTLSVRSATRRSLVRMTPRARPDLPSFNDTVCQATIPPGATAASVPGHALPVASDKLRRIALVGDTGCAQSKGQDCNNPNAKEPWPFAKVASSIADENPRPGLIIHLGDILYRNSKSACPAGCGADIAADFFTPAAPMLAAAPLVMVRGNHEAYEPKGSDCVGWFRYFAFAPAVRTCTQRQRFTPPYRIKLTAHHELIVLDTSAAPDNDDGDVPVYRDELQTANGLVTEPAWLISHVPLWEVAKNTPPEAGPEGNDAGSGILQKALKDLHEHLSTNVRMVISGHLHQFEWLSLTSEAPGQPVPAQLILGDGGTKMSHAIGAIPKGTVVDKLNGVKVLAGDSESKFGYGVVQFENQGTFPADAKSMTIKTDAGSTYKTCSLRGYMLGCSSPALPNPLGDLPSGLGMTVP